MDTGALDGELVQLGPLQGLDAPPEMPTPGSTTPAASLMSRWSAVVGVGAHPLSAFGAEWRLPMP